MTRRTLGSFGYAFALLFCLAGMPLTAAGDNTTLYDRLGGKPAVTAVASGLVDRILQDSRVNGWFVHAAASTENANAYKAKLADFVCQATGGPCKYTGMDMVTAHRGRKVTGAAFDAVVEDLTAVLDKLGVKPAEKSELLGLLGPLKTSIVQP
jgi:hemoglobin